MKVLVAGASGLVGRCLVDLLNHKNIQTIQTYNDRPIAGGYKVNFLNEQELENFFDEQKPTVCINCIVQRFTDVCEKDWVLTKKVNIDLPNIVSRVCTKKNVKLIHISTDYVFDGRKPPFLPTSKVNPLQNYGISKLIAEQRVLANQSEACIIRVPVLYCDKGETLEENAVTVIAKKVFNQVEKTSEDATSVRRPVYIPDFCNFIYDAIIEKYSGIYHFYNPYENTTKYDMAKCMGTLLDLPTSHISPADATGADRPYDTQLMDIQYNIKKYSFVALYEGIQRCLLPYWHPLITKRENLKDIFILLDLDGTLIDTEELHYNSYVKAYKERREYFSREDFYSLLNGVSVIDVSDVRQRKNEILRSYEGELKWIEGAKEFLEYLLENNTNFAIVTNTERSNVEYFKTRFPLLEKVQNWVTREDTEFGKPNKEPYEKAIKNFMKDEKYIVGFENTINGVKSLVQVTKLVYCITNTTEQSYKLLKSMDIRLINDFNFINTLSQDIAHKNN
jgi:S-adenosylmethionine synthetase